MLARSWETRMRFFITMNMPTKAKLDRNGPPAMVHTIIAETDEAETIDEFMELVNNNQFIVVNEVHNDHDAGTQFVSGRLMLNTNFIGKVKAQK